MGIAALILSIWLTPGTLVGGRCSICLALGLRSEVHLSGGASCTLAYCGGGHYDADGQFVQPKPCNTCTEDAKCSHGHAIKVRWLSR